MNVGMGEYLCPAWHWWWLCHMAERCGRTKGRDKGPLDPQNSSQDQSNHQQTWLGEEFLNLWTQGSMSRTWEWGIGGALFSCFTGWMRSLEGKICSRTLQSAGRQFSWSKSQHLLHSAQTPLLPHAVIQVILWVPSHLKFPGNPSNTSYISGWRQNWHLRGLGLNILRLI